MEEDGLKINAYERDEPKEDLSFGTIVKKIVSTALPAIFGLLFIFLLETVNIIFVGQLNSATLINGVGIGTLYCNFTGYVLGLGLIGALDTRCSQCFGSRNYRMMGIFRNTTRVFVCLVFLVVCCPLSLFSKQILLAINQKEDVAHAASIYIWTLLPALFFALNFNIQMRYLQAMKIFNPGMCITFLTFLFHPVWCYLLVFKLDLGMTGAGIAFSFTQFLNMLVISVYIEWSNPCPESYFKITSESLTYGQISEFAYLAVPSALLFAADWIGFEFLTLMSSYLDEYSLAANVCFFNFCSMIFMIALGLSYAGSALVGNLFGERRIAAAKAYSTGIIGFGLFLYAIACVVIYFFLYDIPDLYTQEPRIRDKLIQIYKLYLVFALVDCFQVVSHGIIKGIGRQDLASYICLFVLFPFNIPFSYFLAFYCNYGLLGLWYSQYTSVTILAVSYFAICYLTNWEKLADETLERIETQKKALKQE